MQKFTWKTALAILVIATILFAGVGGWIGQRMVAPNESTYLESVPRFEDGGLLFENDGPSAEMESEPESSPTLSESTEIEALEQDLQNTVILDEDFSDL